MEPPFEPYAQEQYGSSIKPRKLRLYYALYFEIWKHDPPWPPRANHPIASALDCSISFQSSNLESLEAFLNQARTARTKNKVGI
jgi:hypothetical protein